MPLWLHFDIFSLLFFFFSSRRRHTRYWRDWSSDVCSSDLQPFKQGVVCIDRDSHHLHVRRPRGWSQPGGRFRRDVARALAEEDEADVRRAAGDRGCHGLGRRQAADLGCRHQVFLRVEAGLVGALAEATGVTRGAGTVLAGACCVFSRSRISTSSASDGVGAAGSAAGSSACWRRRLLTILTSTNTAAATIRNWMMVLMKAP